MPSEKRRWAKLITPLLAVVGSVALACGLFVAVITMTRTPANHRGINMPLGGSAYVGGDTCFTCHGDVDPDWLLVLNAQPATAPMENPQVVAVEVSAREAVPHLELGSTPGLLTDGKDKQQYIIKTEDDQSFLPEWLNPETLKPIRGARLHRRMSATTIM